MVLNPTTSPPTAYAIDMAFETHSILFVEAFNKIVIGGRGPSGVQYNLIALLDKQSQTFDWSYEFLD